MMIVKHRVFMVSLLACLLLAACTAEHGEGNLTEAFAFVNVNLVPMDRERIIQNQTIIIQDGRVHKIGPAETVKVPDRATVIDGRDKYLMPGLADMHAHVIEVDQLSVLIANGVTTVRNMWGEPKHLEWRQRINDGDLLGPTIYTAGAIIDGDPPVFPESEVVTSPEQARIVVSKQREAGYDFLKVYNNLSVEVYDALITAAREDAIPIAGHVPANVGLDHVLAARQRCIEHLDGYEVALASDECAHVEKSGLAALILTWTELDRNKIPNIVRQTCEAGTWVCPTLIVYEKWVPLAEVNALLERDEFRYLSPSEREFHLPQNSYTNSFTPEIFNAVALGNPVRKELTRLLHDGGVRILLGTDCGNPLVVPGFSIQEELQNFVDAGLTPYEAIKAGTHDAAEFFDAVDEFGTVTVGSRADLILLEGNPLDDVKNIGIRVGVMVRGKWYAESELKSKLDELAAHYSNESAVESMPD
ncbi:MAG: amidohydrolase family protein [Candidatus Eisenbacteria bacterium]